MSQEPFISDVLNEVATMIQSVADPDASVLTKAIQNDLLRPVHRFNIEVKTDYYTDPHHEVAYAYYDANFSVGTIRGQLRVTVGSRIEVTVQWSGTSSMSAALAVTLAYKMQEVAQLACLVESFLSQKFGSLTPENFDPLYGKDLLALRDKLKQLRSIIIQA